MSAQRQREAIRVLIAEDEEPLRSAIADLVASESQLAVAGAVGSADEAIALAAESRPHVALVDVRMPGGGAQAARGIREQSPETRILALSAYEDHATVIEMLRAGAVGYLVKGVAPLEVVEAIRRAARGQASISVDVLARALGDVSGAADAATQQNAQAEREREHAERRALLARLVAAAEEERSRIAGDIHDDSIQAITAARMRLQILRWLRIDTAPGRGTSVEVWLPDVPGSDFGDFPLARSDDSAQDEEAA